ncbi:hypothetical protein Dtox_3389 [Desulfofarcimen acetoxidans DSM 771]|uniref:Uncharacterized protein n=1 Tax=Desulfofarcimen acetoxidans (strain ATCC 49208 / DSM 771 / KCTC 5769 / VKM B-1644 / 5575) TaxID=485916 RepID=C8W6K8_DESAS|nr:hypothetical protein Dtox_3389 [Desulfofarcimen acetoxidans DSM 771]
MDSILKTIVFFFMNIILIGILMKAASYVGNCIGIYNILQDLWGLIRRNRFRKA